MRNTKTTQALIPIKLNSYEGKNKFSFTEVIIEDIEKKILGLKLKNVCQLFDILGNIIKENLDVFGDFFCASINSSIKSSSYVSCISKLWIIKHFTNSIDNS